jgi:hypothetical protein
MKGKALLIMITLIGMVFGGKFIWQKFQEFLQFLTIFLTSSPPVASPEIAGIEAGLGVALFAFLLIILLVLAVAIIQFLLSLH